MAASPERGRPGRARGCRSAAPSGPGRSGCRSSSRRGRPRRGDDPAPADIDQPTLVGDADRLVQLAVNPSTRTVLVPAAAGVSQPLFAGSPRKNGAPSTDSPTTPPLFQSSVAPSACAYHCAADVASGTASISEITGRCVAGVSVCLLLALA